MSATIVQSGSASAKRLDELGQIILAYSEVTDKLEQSHARLEQTVRALRNELSEKSRLLERKNRLAALGEMAAGMAHEIRNPLGGIQLYASLLERDVADRPESKRLVDRIAAGARRLEGIMSHVLQFTREMRVNLVLADLSAVVEETISLAGGAIAQKQITPRVTGPANMPVQIDPLLFGQALLNLVLNAVEAMDQGGTLLIEYSPPADATGGRQLRLSVEDTGPGIPSNIMDRIFNPFFTTRETGTGLGLAIVHRIVEAHDGVITASNREAGGARFEIRI
jgi:signal transduction histidine kinase